MPEFWRAGGSLTTTTMAEARAIEDAGWDGQVFMDSQSLSCDPWVAMGVWAAGTERLRLGTGVTNPLTRHPAVTAACAASLQAVSHGRAVLGIGRGDSALAYLGHAPASLAVFQQTLRDLQSLLRGEEVAFGGHHTTAFSAALDTLSLGDRPTATRLKWLPEGLAKVPLDVAATGPRVIEMAAPIAEKVTFSVGAIAERVAWALEVARQARVREGLPAEGVDYGVQIIVVCHRDVALARRVATDFVPPLARFQVIQGNAAGPQTDTDSRNLAAIRDSYDMNEHGNVLSHNRLRGAELTLDFVERFAIVGTPEHCIERLLEITALGIRRFVIVGPGFHPEATSHVGGLFASEVIPALRAAAG